MTLMVVISMVSPHVHTAESKQLYWKTPFEALQGEAWSGIGNYKVLSVILLLIMAVLFYTFQ
jgi:SSS family solute:Na+ symporter